MRSLLMSNKKAISEIVAYVLLISIAISLSVIVYNWLRFYAGTGEKESCPEGVNLIIKDYSVDCNSKKINITIQNKGLFSVGGFVIKTNDRVASDVGLYTFTDTGIPLVPGNQTTLYYNFSDATVMQNNEEKHPTKDLTIIEVQGFINKGDRIYCEHISSQQISCN